jgi:hypothetical protein
VLARASPGAPPPRKPDPVEPIARWDVAERPRPTLLRSRPAPIEVRADATGRPTALRWERGWEVVSRSRGPERLSGGWWSDHLAFDRTYWVVALRDAVGWIYRDPEDRWFWHGWFD